MQQTRALLLWKEIQKKKKKSGESLFRLRHCTTIQQELLTHSLPRLPAQLFIRASVSRKERACRAA